MLYIINLAIFFNHASRHAYGYAIASYVTHDRSARADDAALPDT